MTLAEDRVAAGAKLLDEKIPDWWQQIDISSLRMDDECRCVLGQLGGVESNLDRIGWEGDRGLDGFTILCDAWDVNASNIGCDIITGWQDGTNEVTVLASFEDLRDAWIAEITSRRTHP